MSDVLACLSGANAAFCHDAVGCGRLAKGFLRVLPTLRDPFPRGVSADHPWALTSLLRGMIWNMGHSISQRSVHELLRGMAMMMLVRLVADGKHVLCLALVDSEPHHHLVFPLLGILVCRLFLDVLPLPVQHLVEDVVVAFHDAHIHARHAIDEVHQNLIRAVQALHKGRGAGDAAGDIRVKLVEVGCHSIASQPQNPSEELVDGDFAIVALVQEGEEQLEIAGGNAKKPQTVLDNVRLRQEVQLLVVDLAAVVIISLLHICSERSHDQLVQVLALLAAPLFRICARH
mmetsp:Transcript_68870/g.165310  ORF Transcript_68870/g.165310 Transcript_68870/m.165310 type:complete len:288 (-) Transcript_68870:1121-1984(-)